MELTIRIEQYARSAVLCLCRPPAGPRPLIFELGANLRAAFQTLRFGWSDKLFSLKKVGPREVVEGGIMRAVFKIKYVVKVRAVFFFCAHTTPFTITITTRR